MVLFGVAEGGLRLAGFEFHGIPTHLQFGRNLTADVQRNVVVPDETLFWRLRVDRRNGSALARRRLVHPALRPLTGAEADGTALRVVALGDSCTFFGSPPYSVLLERELARRGVDARVFNAGLPGYSSFQGRRWLDPEIAGYRPDWVTLYYGWNDHWLAFRLPDHRLGTPGSSASRWARRVVDTFRVAQAALWLWTRASMPSSEGRPLRVPPEQYRDNLESLCERSREIGARVVMITAPSELDADDGSRLQRLGYVADASRVDELHRRYTAIAREVAQTCGAALVDLEAEQDRLGGLVSEDGIHLTPRGAGILSARLADAVAGDASERAPHE